jgi:dihydrofolate reductase
MPPLPEAVVFIAASVDGFIARRDGSLDWLPEAADDGEDYGYAALMASIDALIMGRKTFEVVCSFGGEWPYAGTRVVVLSHQPPAVPEGGAVEFLALPPPDVLAYLGASGTRRVYVDGGQTIRAFLRAGLIREVTVTRVPILLGDGIPLFGSLPADVPLTHLETRAFPSGLVQSRYRIPEAGGVS